MFSWVSFSLKPIISLPREGEYPQKHRPVLGIMSEYSHPLFHVKTISCISQIKTFKRIFPPSFLSGVSFSLLWLWFLPYRLLLFYSIHKPCCSLHTTSFPFSHHHQPSNHISRQSHLHPLPHHNPLHSSYMHLSSTYSSFQSISTKHSFSLFRHTFHISHVLHYEIVHVRCKWVSRLLDMHGNRLWLCYDLCRLIYHPLCLLLPLKNQPSNCWMCPSCVQ